MENKIELLELLYVYIDDIGRCFKNQDFIFSTEYDIKYNNDNNELKINKTEDKTYLKNFFGDNISNINIIAGKNGCGKSTLFSLLGCKIDDLDYIFNAKKSNVNWFCIFTSYITKFISILKQNHFFSF